ncbi:unnamed protein product [Sphagnum tenellum]|jgi:hypothetical protein
MAVSFSLDHGFGGFQEEMATGTSDEAAQDSDEWRNYLTCKLSLAAFQALGISPAVLVINPPDLVQEVKRKIEEHRQTQESEILDASIADAALLALV